MKLGRFIVDTHVHSQRHAAGGKLKGSKEYSDLGKSIMQVDAYDNSPRLLYDMECYGVDMCILEPAFGMSNELNIELVSCHKHPPALSTCQGRCTPSSLLVSPRQRAAGNGHEYQQ